MHGVALSIAEILKEKSITNDYLSLERYPHPPYMQDEFISKYFVNINLIDK